MIITPIPTAHHAVRLFKPHNDDGRWSIQLDGTPQHETNWHCGQFDCEIQMTRPLLVALRDAINRELKDVLPPLPVPSMIPDDDAVPIGVPSRLAGDPADVPTLVIRLNAMEKTP